MKSAETQTHIFIELDYESFTLVSFFGLLALPLELKGLTKTHDYVSTLSEWDSAERQLTISELQNEGFDIDYVLVFKTK